VDRERPDLAEPVVLAALHDHRPGPRGRGHRRFARPTLARLARQGVVSRRRATMADSLTGKVAAITGAASGIGLACARALVAHGTKVVLIDRAEDRLERLCAELGPNAMSVAMDLLQAAQVSTLLARILE